MSSRRNFLRKGSATLAALSLPSFSSKISLAEITSALKSKSDLNAGQLAADEHFWAMIREAYTVSPNIINLNNGGVSPQTEHVQEMQWKYIQMSNEAPS